MNWPRILVALLFLLCSYSSLAKEKQCQDSELSKVERNIRSEFEPLLRSKDFSGRIVVSCGNKSVKLDFGYADWFSKTSISDNTLFSAGSVTKGITLTALLKLESQHKLSLNDPIVKFTPELSGKTDASLSDVIRHRAGLPRDFPGTFDSSNLGSVIDWLKQQESILRRTDEENYSNVGYALLAVVISRVSGLPYADAVKELVLNPIDMRDSFVTSGLALNFPNGAYPHVPGPPPAHLMHPVPSPPELGGTGLVTTAQDLVKWAKFLSSEHYAELHEADPTGDVVHVAKEPWGTYRWVQGAVPGYSAGLISIPERDLVVTYTANILSFPSWGIEHRLANIVSGNSASLTRPRAAPRRALTNPEKFVGTFLHPTLGHVSISRSRGGNDLSLRVTDRTSDWTFYLEPIGAKKLHWKAFGIQLELKNDGSLDAFDSMRLGGSAQYVMPRAKN